MSADMLRPAPSWVFGLWLRDTPDVRRDEYARLRDLTITWSRYGYQGPVIEHPALDAILEQALDGGYQACLIQTPGHIISEDWLLPHWGRAGFHDCLEHWLANEDALVSAELLRGKHYFGLNPECMLINLKHYQALGRPVFGMASSSPRVVSLPRAPTSDDPRMALEPSGETVELIPDREGWGFIHASLNGGYAVRSLDGAFDGKHLSLASMSASDAMPHVGDSLNNLDALAADASLNAVQRRFLDGVATQIQRARSGVFLWNIESYADLPDGPQAKPLSRLYCVAAGFKPNMLLRRQGYKHDTRVCFFDYSQRALDIREILIKEWDGNDYPAFCRGLLERFPEPDTFYQLWDGIQAARIDWADVQHLWQDELARWGGARAFQNHWQAQGELEYRFIRCDLVADPEPLLGEMEPRDGSLIWWSNAFFTTSTNWLHTIARRRRDFTAWIDGLAERCPTCLLYGADHNNTPVNAVSAAEYRARLAARLAQDAHDELSWNGQEARAIRF